MVPLPNGGRALVQPIHQDDVTRCLRAAMRAEWDGPETMVIAGPAPMPYAAFVRAVARAYSLAPPRVVPIPAVLLRTAARLATVLPFVPRVGAGEIRRLTEDKAFDISCMRAVLGVDPADFETGLSLMRRRAR